MSDTPINPEVKRKVMVVEDDKFFIDLLARKLAAAGFEGIYANSGETALEILKKETPDLIVLDILLPGIDGFEIVAQIRRLEQLKNVPIIFLSNLGSKEQLEKAKELGTSKFLIKAMVSPDQIIKEVKTILS